MKMRWMISITTQITATMMMMMMMRTGDGTTIKFFFVCLSLAVFWGNLACSLLGVCLESVRGDGMGDVIFGFYLGHGG